MTTSASAATLQCVARDSTRGITDFPTRAAPDGKCVHFILGERSRRWASYRDVRFRDIEQYRDITGNE